MNKVNMNKAQILHELISWKKFELNFGINCDYEKEFYKKELKTLNLLEEIEKAL